MKYLPALCACLFLFLSLPAIAQPIPKPPSTSGESYILMEAETGKVLAAKNADKRLPPASLTKIMTGYAVYRALDDGSITLDDEVEVSEAAWRMGGSQMFLEVGDKVTVDKLLDGLVVQSGNDAALALAEYVGGSESAFVEQMNFYADELGLENTRFENPEGLNRETHYSSARDMAELSRVMIRQFPERYERYAKREFTYNDIRQYNRNDLLYATDYVDGIKTGYTSESGYCLAASGERDGTRLISVVMGEPSADARESSSRALLSWGHRFYESHRLYAAGETLKEARIWKGAADQVRLGLSEDLHVTIPKGKYDALEASMTFPGQLVAPADEGEELGQVTVKLDGEVVAEAPLVALSGVAAGSFFQRMTDAVLQWFE
ncbi:D-alanyl-D-alanine carboxypeptidase family protein [Halofilum ochraceum]|uniref:D-alanyl-D-alanine carboxypeptidase family protein n=1 Tax=Halofilum ochraceum TaxID=1611323 RepID=UPI0008317E91|nr:D-alanyl-D-alanine carboxypeptidase family protein [Halofilum ochraceum]